MKERVNDKTLFENYIKMKIFLNKFLTQTLEFFLKLINRSLYYVETIGCLNGGTTQVGTSLYFNQSVSRTYQRRESISPLLVNVLFDYLLIVLLTPAFLVNIMKTESKMLLLLLQHRLIHLHQNLFTAFVT